MSHRLWQRAPKEKVSWCFYNNCECDFYACFSGVYSNYINQNISKAYNLVIETAHLDFGLVTKDDDGDVETLMIMMLDNDDYDDVEQWW